MESQVAQTVTAERIRRVCEGYSYKGTEKTELLRKKITVSALKKGEKLIERTDTIKAKRENDFDGFQRTIENGELVLYGKKKYKGRKPGLGGGFRFVEIGPSLFNEDGTVRPEITFEQLARHVYFCETGKPLPEDGLTQPPLIGTPNGSAVYLLYDGVLKDLIPEGPPILTRDLLAKLPPFDGPKVIYGPGCRISPHRLREMGVSFKQIPYDVRVS